jgi:hypothetical protein
MPEVVVYSPGSQVTIGNLDRPIPATVQKVIFTVGRHYYQCSYWVGHDYKFVDLEAAEVRPDRVDVTKVGFHAS